VYRLKKLCQQMHIKRDISNWIIKIILIVLIGAGNPELLSTNCLLSATIYLESDQSEPLGHFIGKRHSPKKSVNFRDQSEHIGQWSTPHHLICNNRDLWAINNLFGTYREYIFWRILQYVSILCYYFILFDDKILFDIKIFNK